MPLSQINSASIEDGAVAPVDLSSVAQYTGFKNRIINGQMVISQYNGASSTTPVGDGYFIDRWRDLCSQGSKFTRGQNLNSVTPPTGFSNYLGIQIAATAVVGASEIFVIAQRIEGFNTADLAWGTASAATVTLSFWVRSNTTGTFGGALRNSAGDRSYPFSYTISAANTWEQKSVTIAGDTTGTWVGATNGIGISLNFSLGTGATLSGTAGAWAAGSFWSVTGATSLMGSTSNVFYVTGVQLEKGVTATSFDYRPYGTELSLCQRYYFQRDITAIGFYSNGAGQILYMTINTPVTTRVASTSTITGFTNSLCSIGISGTSTTDIRIDVTASSAGQCYSINGVIKGSAEL
jgi:hypothetical protein